MENGLVWWRLLTTRQHKPIQSQITLISLLIRTYSEGTETEMKCQFYEKYDRKYHSELTIILNLTEKPYIRIVDATNGLHQRDTLSKR